jgi:hypothetical protein
VKKFRHYDHKFEWTRAEFESWWAFIHHLAKCYYMIEIIESNLFYCAKSIAIWKIQEWGMKDFFVMMPGLRHWKGRVKKGGMSKTLPRRLLKKTFVQSAENQLIKTEFQVLEGFGIIHTVNIND